MPIPKAEFRVPDSITALSGIEFNNQGDKIILFGRDSIRSQTISATKTSPVDYHILFNIKRLEKIK